ncbi:MAG: DNA polymerase III subunit gamma/tau [Anaerolineae bacterium]|nr:DNA polymerase III subunit gamma/tau [Anaerolineae bacterium]NUQ06445.1 DNA polymerase III subunit gamma/tau [Anaerolineae bacterium]
MPQQALYLKWRPARFDDVVGQEHITRTLRNALKQGRVRHAYLFSGPRGTGKTTSARLLAKALNCTDPDPDRRPCNVCPACIAVNEGRYLDLIEIDAATHTGVDDVRDLRDKIAFAPGEGHFKVYIIDEVHRFSGSAFDALLKTLEEPPEHAIFVLATTEIDKVPQTIKSRCLQFEFRRLTVKEVGDRLALICDTEGLRYDRRALEIVARHGTGSARDSISLLDQIVTDPDEPITVELVESVLGTASSAAVRTLAEAITLGDAAEGLRVINDAIDNGTDPRQFGAQTVAFLRAVLIAGTAGTDLIEASEEEQQTYLRLAQQIDLAVLTRAIRAFNDAVNSAKGGWHPQLSLELALVESLQPPIAAYAPPVYVTAAPTASPSPGGESASQVRDQAAAVSSASINEKWKTVLQRMMRYSKTAPEIMRHFRAHHVEGNVVYLGTDNDTYFSRIQPYPEKRTVIERALADVFRAPLTVQVIKVSSQELNTASAPITAEAANDLLLATGLELGAQIERIDPPSEEP